MDVVVLEDIERQIRYFIMQRLAGTGRAPSMREIAQEVGLPRQRIERALHRLEEAHAVALAPASANVWMAFPFSAVPTPFSVEARGVRYWAPCAWDMLSVLVVLGVDSTISAQCPDCGDELITRIRGGELAPTDTVVHFAVPPIHFWDNIGFT